jgi:pilus assembly protein Flp/PilA
MSKLVHFLRANSLLRDDSGATAIEYGLLAAGIAVAIIAAVLAVGTQLDETFESVSSGLN